MLHITEEQAMERVKRGAEVLDRKVPEWETLVRQAGLPLTLWDMMFAGGKVGECGCIIGRTVGDFDYWPLLEDEEYPNSPHLYGFDMVAHTTPADYDFTPGMVSDRTLSYRLGMQLLANCWNQFLAEREAARAQQAKV